VTPVLKHRDLLLNSWLHSNVGFFRTWCVPPRSVWGITCLCARYEVHYIKLPSGDHLPNDASLLHDRFPPSGSIDFALCSSFRSLVFTPEILIGLYFPQVHHNYSHRDMNTIRIVRKRGESQQTFLTLFGEILPQIEPENGEMTLLFFEVKTIHFIPWQWISFMRHAKIVRITLKSFAGDIKYDFHCFLGHTV
jgi:hypothetical protein